MTDNNQFIAILTGVGLALALGLVALIISDPLAWQQALSTPCNIPECL